MGKVKRQRLKDIMAQPRPCQFRKEVDEAIFRAAGVQQTSYVAIVRRAIDASLHHIKKWGATGDSYLDGF